MEKLEIKHNENKYFKISILVTFASFFLIFFGFYNFDINSFDGLIIMVSLLGFFGGIFASLMFRRRIKIIQKSRIIAHFKYSKSEWEDFLKHEYRFRFEEKFILFKLISIIIFFIFTLFIIFIDEGKLAMFVVMMLLYTILFIFAFIIPKITYKYKKASKAEIIIFEKSVLLDKEFHTWDFPFSKLKKVDMIKKPNLSLKFIYEFLDRTGPRKYTLIVPFPKNENIDVEDLIDKILEANSK